MVAAIIFLPNVSSLVRDKGQTQLPSSAKSQVASVIQNHWGRNQNNTRQVVVVFSNGDKPLTATQKQEIDGTIQRFKVQKSKYHVKSMTAASDNAAAKKQLISSDKSTQLLQLMVGENQTVTNMTKNITNGAKTSGVKTYVTGSDILNDDFTQETESGLQKTEIITVIFIFIVLTLVFRSPITPIISLLSVGLSFIISLSIVMNLVEKFNFPLSNFTQVFMVVVLFGIGTDYNILMFDQFKEELSHGDSPVAATGRALKIAGRTILYSGSSLLIGFSALGLANFSIYRSAVGVAIAVAILLLVLLTLNPFFMALLGPKLFWPSKKFSGGSTSKMWHGISLGAVRYPLIALVVVLGVAAPFVFTYSNQLNYDTLAELNDSIPAKQGFKVVQAHFSKGTAEPSTLYIKSDHALNNEKDIKAIDNLTRQLKKVKGVKTVASVSQPGGSEISDLYVKKQLGTVTTGMNSASKGLKKISSGLDSANSQLKSSNMSSGVSSAKELADGAKTLSDGVVTYTNGVYTVNNGLDTLNGKTGTLASGVNQLASGASQVATGNTAMATGTNTLASGTQSLSSGLNTLNGYQSAISSGTSTLAGSVGQLQSGSSQISTGLQTMQTEVNASVNSATSTANQQKLAELQSGLTQLNTALANVNKQLGGSNTTDSISQLTTTATALQENSTKVTSDAAALQTALEKFQSAMGSSDSSVSVDASAVQSIVTAVNQNGGQALTDQQTKALTAALQAMSQQINTQISDKTNSAKANAGDAATSAGQLQTDLKALNATGSSLTTQLKTLSSLTSQLSQIGTLVQQQTTANNGSLDAIEKLNEAIAGMQKIQSGLNGSGSTTGLVDGSQQVTSGLSQLSQGTGALSSQLTQYTNGVATAAQGANSLNTGANTLNSSAGQLASGASQVSTGLTTLQGQIPTLVSAISALDAGTNKLAASSATLTSGASQVAAGNQTMYTTLQSLVKQMATLQKGLATASDGTKTINKGVGSANSYLTGLKKSDAANTYYVPKSTLKGKTYQTALNSYMSSNYHATKLTIVLKDNRV